MRVLLFGASGMVGGGVLRACEAASVVTEVLVIGRETVSSTSPKVHELLRTDFFNWSDVEGQFAGYDACFFPLGVSALGKTEAEYRRVTYDLTLAVAQAVLRASPQAVFIYVSGQGTDSSEKGRSLWARVKGATENALRAMPFRGVYCFRPGYIQPMNGARSKVGWYNTLYAVLRWIYPLLRRVAKKFMTNTDEVGRAMIAIAEHGYPKQVLETMDIQEAAKMMTPSRR